MVGFFFSKKVFLKSAEVLGKLFIFVPRMLF